MFIELFYRNRPLLYMDINTPLLRSLWAERQNFLQSLTYNHYIIPRRFYTPALVNRFSRDFEWKHILSVLQDSSQYSGRSWSCCSFDGLVSSSDFQPFQSSNEAFGIRFECRNSAWYHRNHYIPYSFFFVVVIWQCPKICIFWRFIGFSLCGSLQR